MALPLIPLALSWGKTLGYSALAGAGFTAGSIALDQTFTDNASSLPIELSQDIEDHLEDIIKTNKALLQYRNVRQDLYEPLNIDAQ